MVAGYTEQGSAFFTSWIYIIRYEHSHDEPVRNKRAESANVFVGGFDMVVAGRWKAIL